VGREQERRVEGGDPHHRSNRKAPQDADASFSGGDDIERNDLATYAFGLLGGHLENSRGTHHLTLRVAETVPGFERHLTGEEIGSVPNYLPRTREDLGTAKRGEPSGDLEGIDCRYYRVLHILRGCPSDARYRFSRVRIDNRHLSG
jgi:hypothetical protein